VNPAEGSWIIRHEETQDQIGKPLPTTTTDQNNAPPRTSNWIKKTPTTMNKDFLWIKGPPNSSSLITSVVTKSDTDNSTTLKPAQLSKKHLKQFNVKLDKNDDINNRFSIYYHNIRGFKGENK
jgi:hypothetical protein